MTIKNLQTIIDRLNTLLPGRGFHLDRSSSGCRLCSGNGRDISPRLTSTQLFNWMHAYMSGIEEAQRQEHQKVFNSNP